MTTSPLISMLLINTFTSPPPLKAPFPSPVLTLVPTPTAAPPFAVPIPIVANPLTQNSTLHITTMVNYIGETEFTANTPTHTSMQKKFSKTQPTKSRPPSRQNSASARNAAFNLFIHHSKGDTPCPPSSAASSAKPWAISEYIAHTRYAPRYAVSKVEYSPLPAFPGLSFPTSSIPVPSRAQDCDLSFCVRFLFPSAFLIDVLLRASTAQSLFVLDCTEKGDYPLFYFISESPYLSKQRPHHLIIALPSCTLHVLLFPDVFLSRFTLRTPPTIPSLRRLNSQF